MSSVGAAEEPLDYHALRINEVMCSNVTAWADNLGEFQPWVELYNTGTNAVDLTGFLDNTDVTICVSGHSWASSK